MKWTPVGFAMKAAKTAQNIIFGETFSVVC